MFGPVKDYPEGIPKGLLSGWSTEDNKGNKEESGPEISLGP